MKKNALSAIVAASLILPAGCAPDYLRQVGPSEAYYFGGKPVEAARLFLPYINAGGKDRLLFLMEAGLMLFTAENYRKSADVLMSASRLLDKIPISATGEIGAMYTDDRLTNYRGQDFERVLVHMYLGLDFLMLDRPYDARVEFKAVTNELERIRKETGRIYKQNIMAKYLNAIAHEMVGDMDKSEEDWEFALIEFKQINMLRPGMPMVYRDMQRLAEKLRRGKNAKPAYSPGELIVVFEAGQTAVKQSRGRMLDGEFGAEVTATIAAASFGGGLTAASVLAGLSMAENPIPKFVRRSNRIAGLNIRANNQYLGRTIMLEDIENTAVRNLDDDYSRLRKRVAAGLATKVITTVTMSIAAQVAAEAGARALESQGGWAGLFGSLGRVAAQGVGPAVALATFSQIRPDLRCWRSLPANLQFQRFFLQPGNYVLTLEFVDRYGRVVRVEKDQVKIAAGKRSFKNFRTLY
ncbi:MAG TPA: hypothetical protein PLA65_08795 [Spirochaetota bacterium]|nr:hypothetical protein [Spirochaetota bacterium]HOD15729.1 hypothetical protein [Spirochaetota bacterium]HPG50063.1 hypothetical protein [Spirochaetota bacterium]HPN12145.1 hypothetical protein [Spirochaetota bacterium]